MIFLDPVSIPLEAYRRTLQTRLTERRGEALDCGEGRSRLPNLSVWRNPRAFGP